MTEKKQIPEQTALYTYQTPVGGARASRPGHSRDAAWQGRQQAPQVSKRVVTVPNADLSRAGQTFAQRQETQRQQKVSRAYSQPLPYTKTVLVPRTLAQTGTRASSGRIAAVRPRLPYRKKNIPLRSRRQHTRRGLLWRILSIFTLGTVSLLAIGVLFTSSAFRIQQLDIAGTHNSDLIQSIQHMGVQGQNIFLLSTSLLAQRISAFPLVASVSLSKQMPDQLNVVISERRPALLWQDSLDTYSVDREGVVIEPESLTSGTSHLSVIDDITTRTQSMQLHPGTHLDKANVLFALAILQRFPRVTHVSIFKLFYDGTMYASADTQRIGAIRGNGSYIVESPAGWKVYLGGVNDSNPLDNRLMELRAVLDLTQKQKLNLATIDLRYGLHPVFTLQQ